MRTDVAALTVEQVLEDLILDVQLFISSRAALSLDEAAHGRAQPAAVLPLSPSPSTLADVQMEGSTSTSGSTEPLQNSDSRHTHSPPVETSTADIMAVAKISSSHAVLQPPIHEAQILDAASTASTDSYIVDGSAATAPASDVDHTEDGALQLQTSGDNIQSLSVASSLLRPPDSHDSKSSKLLALKKHRLESLSSSLDLSRESSFDASAFTSQQADAKHAPSSPKAHVDMHGDAAPAQPAVQNSLPLDNTTGLEGRSVMLQCRSSSISKKASSLISMLPSFESTRPQQKRQDRLPALQQPAELSMPLRDATATAKTHAQMQDALMQRHHAVMRDQRQRQQRRQAAEQTQHAQMLGALLEESSERRAALEARQAARAAQLLARQEQMAAAAEARRRERLQHVGHLPAVLKPATRKEELQQLHKIEEAEANLRKLLAEHKQMYTAEQRQQEQQEHQQAAAQHRTEEARHRARRRELGNNAASWGFPSTAEQPTEAEEDLLPSITSRKAGASRVIQQAQQQLYKSRQYDNVPARVTQQQQDSSGMWNDTAAAQRAFRKEAQRRRMQQKEFHARQSIRQRQQEYDQAVKARLAQDSPAMGISGRSNRDNMETLVDPLSKSDLPQIVPGPSGSNAMMLGPRAKRLQAIARHPPTLQELARPPRQISRIPDDMFLPSVANRGPQPSRAASSVQFMIEQSPRLDSVLSIMDGNPGLDLPATLPAINSQRSRRLTQEMLQTAS